MEIEFDWKRMTEWSKEPVDMTAVRHHIACIMRCDAACRIGFELYDKMEQQGVIR